MPTVIAFIVPMAVAVAFYCMRRGARRREAQMDPDDFAIQLPPLVAWIGLVDLLLFGGCIVIMTLFPNDTVVWWVYVIFILFSLLGVVLLGYAVTFRIVVNRYDLKVTSPFSKTKVYAMNDITRAEFASKTQILKIYSGDKMLFDLGTYYIGFGSMVSYLERNNIPLEEK